MSQESFSKQLSQLQTYTLNQVTGKKSGRPQTAGNIGRQRHSLKMIMPNTEDQQTGGLHSSTTTLVAQPLETTIKNREYILKNVQKKTDSLLKPDAILSQLGLKPLSLSNKNNRTIVTMRNNSITNATFTSKNANNENEASRLNSYVMTPIMSPMSSFSAAISNTQNNKQVKPQSAQRIKISVNTH